MNTTRTTLRRRLRRLTASTTAVVVSAAALAAAPPAGGADDDQTQPRAATVTLTEGTNIAAALAPDGSVVMDLHGLLHRVPAGGGETRRLTTAADEAARPDVGPDGRIVFQAYRDGGFHIWTTAPDGGDLTQLTSGGFDDREPRWSPDGAHVAFSSDRGGSYDIWSIEVATGALTQWTKAPGQEFTPSWSPDGARVVHVADNQVVATDRAGASTVLVPRPATGVTLNVPAMAPDGQRVAYVEQQGTRADLKVDGRAVTQGQDVFLFTPEWSGADGILYTADGGIRTVVPSTGATSEVPFRADVRLTGRTYPKKEHDFDARSPRGLSGVLTPQLSPDGRRVLFRRPQRPVGDADRRRAAPHHARLLPGGQPGLVAGRQADGLQLRPRRHRGHLRPRPALGSAATGDRAALRRGVRVVLARPEVFGLPGREGGDVRPRPCER